MLPTNRNTAYAAGAQVKSADLNALQDAVINRNHPNFWTWFPPARSPVETNLAWGVSGGEYNSYVTASGGTGVLSVLLRDLTVGDRLTNVGAYFNDPTAAGGSPHLVLNKYDFTQVGVPGGTIGNFFANTVPTTPNQFGQYTFALGTPEVVAAGYVYVLNIHWPSTQVLGPIGFAKDRL